MSDSLKRTQSGCTDLFCQEHKTGVLKCATSEFGNLVSAQLVFGASKFLDDGYDDKDRPVAAVMINEANPTEFVI